jgi:AraC-like DNA-binding protein
MPDRAENVFYSHDIALRRGDGGPARPSHVTIRHTEVYRLRSVRSVSVNHLEPGRGDVFLLGSLQAPMTVHAGEDSAVIAPEELVVVTTPEFEISTASSTDMLMAVSQGTVIRGLGLIDEAGPSITRIPINPMLAAPLNAALIHAVDLLDENTGALDPRVIDFLHLMSRGLIQLPPNPQTADESTVSVFDRARALIAAMHTSPATTPASVADALGVPLRTVQRAFAAEGRSVARELRSARARTAHALLAGGPTSTLALVRIAEDSGFGSAASLRRALRELAREDGYADGEEPPLGG